MPWKCIVCGCCEPFTKRMRRRSPSRARSVGPGHAPVVGPGGVLDARARPRSRGPRRRSPTRAPRRATMPSSKSRRIACGSKPLPAWSTRPTAPQVTRAAVGGVVVLDGGLGRRGAAVQALMRDQLVQHGQRGARGGGAAEQPAARDFVIPQLSHQRLLKHVLGETKNRIADAAPPARAREYDRRVIATSEYELVTESAGLVDRSERGDVRGAGRRGRGLPAGPGLQRRGGARPRPGLLRDDPQPQGQAAHRPARPARRRLLLARHRARSATPCCGTCSTPTRSGATCSWEDVGESARAAVADRPGRRRPARRRRRRPTSTPSSTPAPGCGCAPTSASTCSARPRAPRSCAPSSASRRSPRRWPSACASSPGGRASGSTWTPTRSPRRPASTSAPSTSRRAATSARRRSRACTTRASRTATCAACGCRSRPSGAPRSCSARRSVGRIGSACVSPRLGPDRAGAGAARGGPRRHGAGRRRRGAGGRAAVRAWLSRAPRRSRHGLSRESPLLGLRPARGRARHAARARRPRPKRPQPELRDLRELVPAAEPGRQLDDWGRSQRVLRPLRAAARLLLPPLVPGGDRGRGARARPRAAR